MTQAQISDALGLLDDTILEETAQVRSSGLRPARPPIRVRLVALAACLCLLLGTITVLAANGFGTWILQRFTAQLEPGTDFPQSGFDLGVEIGKLPAEALTGEICRLSSTLIAQFQDYKPFSSQAPGTWQAEFPSASQGRAYIGYSPLKGPDWDLEEAGTTLYVQGDSQGEILSVTLETDYEVDDLRLQAFSSLYTEAYPGQVTIGTRTTETVEFSERFDTTLGQKQLHILTSTATESGYCGLDGFWVQDGVLYQLHIAHLAEDARQAEELLHQWADSF